MPFTFAHPLYIAPAKYIKPRVLSLTGLILGSMAPDFEYFIALEPYQWIGHTHVGLLVQAIPLCVVILWLMQLVMKPFVMHLPSMFDLDQRAYKHLHYFDYRRLTNWIVFLVSVAIGFYSHVFIDGFTHSRGYFVMKLHALQSVYWGLPVFKLLQYSLSVFGMMAQLVIVVLVLSRTSVAPKVFTNVPRRRKVIYWLCVAMVAAATTLGKLVLTSSTNTLGILVVAPISGLMLGIVAAGFMFRKTTAVIRSIPNESG